MTDRWEEPDHPTDEEIEEMDRHTEWALGQGDALRRGEVEDSEEAGKGDTTSPPQTVARVYAYIPRSVKPDSWNRKTRWGNGTRRLPSPPEEATQHVRMQWGFMLARLVTEGWAFCRQHEKQDPAWYVDFAKALAREAVLHHLESDCPRACTDEEWTWLLDKTDKTPVLDATPYPSKS